MILPRFRFRCMLFFVVAATTIGVVSVLAIPVPVGSDASAISTPSESPASTNDVHAPASPQHKPSPVPISLDPGTISAPESPASANVHTRPASRGQSGPGAISAPESLASANVHARPASLRGQSGSGTVSTPESPASEAINVHSRPASPQGESGPVPIDSDASTIATPKSSASDINVHSSPASPQVGQVVSLGKSKRVQPHLADPSLPLIKEFNAKEAARFKPLALEFFSHPARWLLDIPQWKPVPDDIFSQWVDLLSHYVLDSNNALYKLVRRDDKKDEPTFSEKMKEIRESKYYKEHNNHVKDLLEFRYELVTEDRPTLRPGRADMYKMLFNGGYILATANNQVDARINMIQQSIEPIYGEFKQDYEDIIAHINSRGGVLRPPDIMIQIMLADNTEEYRGAYYLSGAYKAVPVTSRSELEKGLQQYFIS
ncbi:hypothetical protein F5880DRAFT_1253716 [Lentinula raphanica]|nr:hypothetical protein F5880DRAFT_1253716 [Lentinula raphanica]